MFRKLMLIAALIFSVPTGKVEARTPNYNEIVACWYRDYLGRRPDAAGFENWMCELRRGLSLHEAQAAFLASDEYYHRNGCNDVGYVHALYRDILGRRARPAEIENWACRIRVVGSRQAMTCEFLTAAQGELARRPVVVPFGPPPEPEEERRFRPTAAPVRPVIVIRR